VKINLPSRRLPMVGSFLKLRVPFQIT